MKNLKWIRLPAGMLLVLSMTVTSLYAHHGRGATYDMKKRVTLKGTVDDSHGDELRPMSTILQMPSTILLLAPKIEPKC